MQKIFNKLCAFFFLFFYCLSFPVAFDILSSLYRDFMGSRDRKFGSLNREFGILGVRYIERIYKSFLRINSRETTLGSLNRGVRYIGGSLYRESTVYKKPDKEI